MPVLLECEAPGCGRRVAVKVAGYEIKLPPGWRLLERAQASQRPAGWRRVDPSIVESPIATCCDAHWAQFTGRVPMGRRV